MLIRRLAVLILAVGWAGAAHAQTAARPQTPKTYNETADARQVIAAQVNAAATDDIRVLVNWGANDDDACAKYLAVQNARENAAFWSDEYRRVFVDVGHADRNLDVAKQYGVKLEPGRLPMLTVLDRDGKVIVNISAHELMAADGTTFSAPLISTFLKTHQAPQPNDTENFNRAVNQAKQDGKIVFVWFSAPW